MTPQKLKSVVLPRCWKPAPNTRPEQVISRTRFEFAFRKLAAVVGIYYALLERYNTRISVEESYSLWKLFFLFRVDDMEKRCTPEFKMGLLTMGIVVNLATGKDENLRKKKKKRRKKKNQNKSTGGSPRCSTTSFRDLADIPVAQCKSRFLCKHNEVRTEWVRNWESLFFTSWWLMESIDSSLTSRSEFQKFTKPYLRRTCLLNCFKFVFILP